VSHRYIISWMKLLEDAIAEQQKIFIQRGNLDPSKSKIGYYLI
jgi:DNA-directed RNA polymerase